MKLRLAYLYPSVLSQYGDRGNVLCLRRRAEQRGIEVELLEVEVGDRLDPAGVDLVFMGGGTDAQQRFVARDLLEAKGDALREALSDGAALLAVCAGYQLLGHFYRAADGTELEGLGIFDAYTVHRAAEAGSTLDSVPAAGAVRAVGNVLVASAGDTLVGFENHGGRTYLGAGAQALGEVVVGRGNNGADRTEGCQVGDAIGTYLHGPALPKNPRLADRLIHGALRRRYGSAELASLDDSEESAAHDAAVRLVLGERRERSPAGEPLPWPGTTSGRRVGLEMLRRARHLRARHPEPSRGPRALRA